MVDFYQIASAISVAIAVLSLLCSIVMSWLLLRTSNYRIEDMPDYILILLIVSIAQSAYDFGVILYVAPKSDNQVQEAGYGIRTIIIFVFLWTNVMSFLVAYLVVTKKVFNLRPFIPGLLLGTLSIFITFMTLMFVYWEKLDSGDNSVYFTLSLAYSIATMTLTFFNFVTISASMVHLYHNGIKRTSVIWGKVERMMYYPIVQVVIKIPIYIYIYQYNSLEHSYDQSDASVGQTVLLFIEFICLPLGGILYLAIYLYEEPGVGDLLVGVIYKTVGWDYVAPPPVETSSLDATIDVATIEEERVAIEATEENQVEGDYQVEELEKHYVEELANNFSSTRNPLVGEGSSFSLPSYRGRPI